jgi:hypothetical protein
MKPNYTYVPYSLSGQGDWFGNFSAQFTLVGASLGFSPAEVTAVQADNQLVQFLVTANTQMNAVMDAARSFRNVSLEGDNNDATPSWPAQFAGSPADPPPSPGVWFRLDKLVKRIRNAPNYTAETGSLLGIIPSKSDPIAPELMKPDPSVSAMPGNIVEVYFTRGKTSGVDVQIQLDNSGQWITGGRFTKSPAELDIPENPQNLPRSVQIRARYFQGNTPVGQYSDVDTIATTP